MKQDVRPIFLVQRAAIQRPLSRYTDVRLSKAVDFDYMGSTEFENGSIWRSLQAIEVAADALNLRVVPEIVKATSLERKSSRLHIAGSKLHVVSLLTDAQWAEYLPYLLEIRQEKRRLKEQARFSPTYDLKPGYSKTDFWWDIQNHVMWSFDKDFMSGLVGNIAASINYMNEQKASA